MTKQFQSFCREKNNCHGHTQSVNSEPAVNCHLYLTLSKPCPWQQMQSVNYLLRSVEQLLGHSCGHDGPAGGCTGLQEQREPRHQLHPQVCDGHFVIQHCHCLLCQDGVRQRGQNLWRNTEEWA